METASGYDEDQYIDPEILKMSGAAAMPTAMLTAITAAAVSA